MAKYNPSQIESKWQKIWQAKKIYAAKDFSNRPKKFILVEFPYPSGAGLHMGHLRPYVAADVYARYYRMHGFEVIFPMGWDAFGLPAENYAIKMGVHPSVTTKQNIANAKKQMHSWGLSFDWSREVNTTDPNYYKWTQWIFLQLLKAGLAYEATGLINWCPKDKTGLANEEVIDGKCERCGTEVEKKEMKQWYLKITAYAEKLLSGLKDLPQWPEAVKLQQENWIGKSVGAEIEFPIVIPEISSAAEKLSGIQNSNISTLKNKNMSLDPGSSTFVKTSADLREAGMTPTTIRVFTTRPDTIFGATYMVVAPEHELISNFKYQISNWEQVQKYIEKAKNKTEIDRTAEGKEKTGVELKGIKAVNPATKKEIPVWVADYVLGGYGTGAIMAVPAHDERDFEFAKKYKLEIRPVVAPFMGPENEPDKSGNYSSAYIDYGTVINSGKFTNLKSEEAIPKMAEEFGKISVQYKLRDWVFSRQRYWGEPIPVVHCEDHGIVPVPEKDLPVKLPNVKKYEPTGTGESPLAAIDKWVKTKCPKCKKLAWRETNTMPQWAGSSWYWLRYTDPKNSKKFSDIKKQKNWTPVDVYFGGMEHTTLHLLYSRFWNLFLYDKGFVTAKEPYKLRKPHGIVLGPDGEKMSKSRGNVVDPQTIVKQYGADTLRMYELFLGPHEAMVAWNDKGIVGVKRFLDRVWQWANDISSRKSTTPFASGGGGGIVGEVSGLPKKAADGRPYAQIDHVQRALHRLIKKITEDIENFRFNTAISAFMEFHNEVKDEAMEVKDIKTFLILLYPFAPHIAEELNQIISDTTQTRGRALKQYKFLQAEPWPLYDASLIVDKEIEIVVQINGKVKGKVKVSAGSEQTAAEAVAKSLEAVKQALKHDTIKRTIYVKDRLINLVI